MRRAALLVSALLLSGCAAQPPASLPEGVTVSVLQNRSDPARERMQIRVENGTDDVLTITAASLSDERLDSGATWAGASRIPPGVTRDLPVDLPDATCTENSGSASVELAFTVGGEEGAATVEPEDPFGLLSGLREQACGVERLGEAAAVEWSGLERDGDVAKLILQVDAREDVVLQSVARTILLQPTDGSEGWTLDRAFAAGESAAVVLDAEPGRCDPHAVAEDKVGTRFRVTVELDGEPLTVMVPAPEEVRGAIYDYLGEVCGTG